MFLQARIDSSFTRVVLISITWVRSAPLEFLFVTNSLGFFSCVR
jgi:hypothetical protein